ncbi:M20 family metallopeptidase [Cellulomonas denverensis]|uniref:Peptidase M20 domain-containing protein 2 n=1 Tax=Cellulomonas denverensis TaxID=264297 RepID=A0A7X6KYH6_9CELL|nr:M20 family metallopeptidase [Cellulomonas denverensis]NKY24478.1 M20 family metallopeptidase [Cellulomonas denverensis]GIG25395.1 putative peptidase/amidohydrolase [Cellulomonas denverensis]
MTLSLDDATERVTATLDRHRERLLALSHALHEDPELAYQEHRSAARVAAVLAEAGFATEVGVYGLDTAVEAVTGTGDLTVTLCAEYDALPGIGHACGHNIIATAAVGAALALAPLADAAGLRVTLLGTPAEEHGGGKVDLLLAGAWEDAAMSLMVHGMSGVDAPSGAFAAQAVQRVRITFTGRASHAAAAPEHGINAGAAATLALTGIGLLRQHLPAGTSVNAFVEHGGDVTNIIPAHAEVQLEVRAGDVDVWRETYRRVLACFEGAAIATGCSWTVESTEHPYAPLASDPDLSRFWDAALTDLGRTIDGSGGLRGGSTDMGNVSQVVPSIHPTIAILGTTAAPHTPDFAAAARTPAGDRAALDGAAALARTVLAAALDPQVRADLLRRRAERPAGATRSTLHA